MNVKDFEYVVEIAKHGSISKAAAQLYVSQPTISKFLQRIERELGMPLFHRMGKQLVPTPAGECLITKAQSILNLHQQILGEIQDISTFRHGTIRMGIPDSRIVFIITSVLPAFQQHYPYIKLTIEPNATNTLIKKLEQGELDLLVMNYADRKDGLHYQDIGEEEMVLAVPPNSPLPGLAQQRPHGHFPYLAPHHWTSEPFILAGEMLSSGKYTRAFFARMNISPPIALEMRSINHILLAVRHGLGLTIAPSIPWDIRDTTAPVYLAISEAYIPINIACVTRKGQYLNEAEQALISIMQEHYRQV